MKHDQKNQRHIPQQDIAGTLSHIFGDFSNQGRFALMHVEDNIARLANTITAITGNPMGAPSFSLGTNSGMGIGE